MALLDYVKALEGEDNETRGRRVVEMLRAAGLCPAIQTLPVPRIRNIVVDFGASAPGKRVLFSAHYDAVTNSPGANDNASGVAVLLELCHELKEEARPVRVIFFDREEAWLRTPWLRLGLLGSLCYVARHRLGDVAALYNLEFCGLGDTVVVWPVTDSGCARLAVSELARAAGRLGVPWRARHVPWPLFTSDHLPFRLRGVADSVTLTAVPAGSIATMEDMLSHLPRYRLPSVRRSDLPEPFSVIHTSHDASARLREESLQLMLSVVRELARGSWVL